MELGDLKTFLVAARHASLRAAADELHQSASALSKAIRRLEASLATPLFDRVGKALKLNAQGEQLRERALALLAQAEQTRALFRGGSQPVHCRVIGPALLQWRDGPRLAQALRALAPDSACAFVPAFEDAALAALARGEAHFALATRVAVASGLPAGLAAESLGTLAMRLAAGPAHPLVTDAAAATPTAVLAHDFACPSRSLFCGLDRGPRSDGWPDDRLPRRIRFRVEDLQVLIALVRSGQALAWLPDFALSEAGLAAVPLDDAPAGHEEAMLVWHPGQASGWQQALVERMTRR